MPSQEEIDQLVAATSWLPAPRAVTDRLERVTPALADVDRTMSNVLSVFPELRIHVAYVVMLRDADGLPRALKGNVALEGELTRGRAAFAAFLRECADALDEPEHHHIEARIGPADDI